ETQSGQLARLVHADCRPNVTASWNTVQLLGVPQEGKGQADLLRRLKVFGRKQSLPSSGVPVRAAGTRSRYKVGILLRPDLRSACSNGPNEFGRTGMRGSLCCSGISRSTDGFVARALPCSSTPLVRCAAIEKLPFVREAQFLVP